MTTCFYSQPFSWQYLAKPMACLFFFIYLVVELSENPVLTRYSFWNFDYQKGWQVAWREVWFLCFEAFGFFFPPPSLRAYQRNVYQLVGSTEPRFPLHKLELTLLCYCSQGTSGPDPTTVYVDMRALRHDRYSTLLLLSFISFYFIFILFYWLPN